MALNIRKHQEVFNPLQEDIKYNQVHIIGCGAIGSYLALQLIKLGISSLHIWDFDKVEEHNITNQLYDTSDVGSLKTEALKEKLLKVNPEARIIKNGKWDHSAGVQGIVFLAVDNITTRKELLESNETNINLKLVIDVRMGLTQGQIITTNWKDKNQIRNHIEFSQFSQEEVVETRTACGNTLNVSPTVLLGVATATSSFIKFFKNLNTKQILTFDAFEQKLI